MNKPTLADQPNVSATLCNKKGDIDINLQAVLQSFQAAELSSQVLRDLTTPGRRLPKFADALKELLQAADWEAAAQQGRIVPNQVIPHPQALHVKFHMYGGSRDFVLSLNKALRRDESHAAGFCRARTKSVVFHAFCLILQ